MTAIRSKPHALIAALGVLCAGALWSGAASGAGDKSDTSAQRMQDKQMQGQQAQDKQMKGQQAKQGGQTSGRPQVEAIGLVIAPLAVVTADTMNNGCWARFYSGENFEGDVLTLSGPVSLANMGMAQPYWGEADSAIIGPKARVTIYDNDNFNDQTAVLQPDQRIDDLRDKLAWHEGVESARVECTG